MAQPNLTVVIGKRKKKKENSSKPTTNAFWSQINKPPIPIVQYPPQMPIRSLTEVPTQPKLLPQKPALVELLDDNSPHIPSSTMKTAKTNKNPAAIIAANTAKNIAANMAKKKAANMAKQNVIKNIAANIAQKVAVTTAIHNAAQAIANAAQNPGTDSDLPEINKPRPFSNQQEKKWRKFQAKIQLKAAKQRLTWNKPTDPAATQNEPGPSGTPQNVEANKNVALNESPQSSEASNTSLMAGYKIPTLDRTTKAGKITLKTKKNLRVEMMKQQLAWRKLDPNVTGSKPGPIGTPENEDANQNVTSNETTQSSESSNTSMMGSTIPTLEHHTVQPQVTVANVRSTAGNFFKPAGSQQSRVRQPWRAPADYEMKPLTAQTHNVLEIPIQQHPAPRGRREKKKLPRFTGAFSTYSKGIPKSFLLQQQKSQDNNETMAPDAPIWPSLNVKLPNTPTLVQPHPMAMGENINVGGSSAAPPDATTSPIFVETENQVDVPQPYSPSDIYSEYGNNPEPPEELESSEQSGQKRLSAFQRLGPLSQPKKPKLTINLTLNKEQPVREVVNDTDDDPDRYTPVHLRQDIIMSSDTTVMKYLTCWPWRKNVGIRRSATARNSRSVMILEQEQMEEAYEKDNFFIQITVKGYPSTWTKERVLDAILESVRGYSLIPCFTEFYQHECKFLTLRSRSALIILHKTGFYIHKDGVELAITISQTDLTLNQIDYIPRIILRKRVSMGYADKRLNLSAFTLQHDVSHFIYFPLNRISNQSEFIQLQSVIEWDHLTHLDLSHNRLTNISGFDLRTVTPRLKHLNLSHNLLEKITVLINCRDLPLKTIHLEGNPLCNDYIQPEHYIKVLRMMFPAIVEIDGVPIQRKGQLPQFKQNYCPEDAKEVAEKFLDIYFPLLDSGPEHRSLIQGMYEDDATLTVTYAYKLRYGQIYRCFRNLFLYARFLDEGETDSVMGAMAITKLINRWPHTEHDPFTFTVDVLYHTESTTILRVGGVLKLTAETLAEDEHLLTFTRTVVLYSEDGEEYKIQNEILYWDEPTAATARSAFRVNTISQKKINLKIESTTDEDLREKFLKIFMKLTTMDKKISERCLEMNNWNFKLALEHFTKLLKINNLDSLMKEEVAN